VALPTEGKTVLFDISNILKKITRHKSTVFISPYTIKYQQNYLYLIFNFV